MNYDKLSIVKSILKKFNQEQLLYFYDSLDENEKSILLEQILHIDFDQISELYINSMQNNFSPKEIISPLNHFEKNLLSQDEIHYYTTIGNSLIKTKSYAIVTMAGGQGTRLGYKGPKGTYMLDIFGNKKSLFEIICEDLKRSNEKYNICLDWYIMTSMENNKQTINFFEENDYFNYPKEKITFFIQSQLPLINTDGKLILQEPYLVKEAANGNGNVFNSMLNYNIINKMEKENIQWIFFGGIDNILLKNIDPLFLGMTAEKNYKVASKSIFKKDALEKTAVYCKKDGKPSILDYDEIDLALSEQKDENNQYLYREANILSHIFHISAIKKVSTIKLKYHRAFKKNAFVNFEGVKQVPDKPNTFKFENFIFDAFAYFDDMLLLRVDENEEFAPIKSFTGIYNPDSALEKYTKYWNKEVES